MQTSSRFQRFDAAGISRYAVALAFLLLLVFFSMASPSFLTPANLFNILVNNVVLLAVIAFGMTVVISAGGIDLSVGVSVDMASMVFIMLLAAGWGAAIAIPAGLAAALCVGLLNSVLITRLRISPFLATLGVLFIGQSVQQIATGGGQPIYLVTGDLVKLFTAIVRAPVFGVPMSVIIFALCGVAVYLTLHKSVFGRYVSSFGAQPGVAWYSGIRVPFNMSLVYIACALLCGVAGILLSSTVRSYVPLSGNAFLLDAIGATFIGTTISAERRPSVIGTLLGVALLAVVKNGLLLIGWNFYWQQVGIGVLVFLVLALSFGLRGRDH
ncbi:ABC transporter permease [Rhizobium sp. P38BS-XIX]|uniref:ABC transporter permease n=1 Tax=Rhizobium sp. P38BS-XIX TaxID=2726740 RepID=UPI0014567B97|nr:ABC transporter permease [Rhizobium sp. P38BS-XIX]NLS00020.1 ABC transporter permease [Rhizobium sp. P38BS-XIX]